MTENEIGAIVVDVAVRTHRALGPGLLESVHEAILVEELRSRGLSVERQVPVAISYRGFEFEKGFRADIVVENKVIIELKCVESVNYAHKKQLLTYLRLTGMKLGFLLNFSEALMKDGITRNRAWPRIHRIALNAGVAPLASPSRALRLCERIASTSESPRITSPYPPGPVRHPAS